MATTDTSSIEEKLTAAARADRLTRAQSLTKNYMLAAAGLGLIPIPLVDLGGLMALQIKLVHSLANHYQLPFKENVVKSLVTSLVSGATSVVGVMGLASLAKTVPILGTLGGGGGVAVTAAAVTYAVGEVFIRHFESGGTLLDFDPHKMKALFKRELKNGKVAATESANPQDEVATTEAGTPQNTVPAA
jgi:uncharacterized protein (DUF697 family)